MGRYSILGMPNTMPEGQSLVHISHKGCWITMDKTGLCIFTGSLGQIDSLYCVLEIHFCVLIILQYIQCNTDESPFFVILVLIKVIYGRMIC
ncbi:hypothetical protein GDO78_005818 [Eleutherodactylus coqui]|uniref:Uncharacterized protein n=1 Tax=Eleutherodactylus coqui TaxID=57060 RepID=A0A8J6FM75_ELECQ|nr:hypothetical protein GDO78_005818 [Eleutherodactylus coqui]